MNKDIFKGKLKQDKADAKIWFGKKIGSKIIELDGNKDKIIGYFQENHGMLKEEVAEELKKFEIAKGVFETKALEVETRIQSQFDKLTHSDIKEIQGSLENFANTVKEKYDTSTEEANKKIKAFMSQF